MSILTLCTTRSLGIHTVDLYSDTGEISEGYGHNVVEEEQKLGLAFEENPRVSTKQLVLIYSLQLVEAVVAASLQPQLYVLLRDSGLCESVNSVYWTSLVEAIFALGSTAGLLWGRIGDRRGRRPIALMGMFGLSMSCIAMGFSDSIFACSLIRLFTGLMSCSIRVAVATMIGDVSDSSVAKARNFSRLPLISTGGVIGPLLQAALAHKVGADSTFWQRFPILSSQLACATLISMVFFINLVFLEETMPRTGRDEGKQQSCNPRGGSESPDECGEKHTFFKFTNEENLISNPPEPIRISEILRAPSLMVILCSFSFLSLHSASFDQLLPLLGNSPTEHGGLGLPCSFISLVVLSASISAGVVIAKYLGRAVRHLGLLRLYRLCCWGFPAIYIATALVSKLVQGSQVGIIISSMMSIFTKTLVTGFSQTLVVLLVTNASPDQFSLATIMGFMQCVSVFRSLAVVGTAVVFSLDDELSLRATNYGLWSTMTIISLGGAVIAYFVHDHPTVRDYRNSLKWEVCYDSTEELGIDEKTCL